MIGQGVSSRSSHSAAAGRTTCSANPWTQSRTSRWSWLSSRVKLASESWAAAPSVVAAATACCAASDRPTASMGRILHQTMSHCSVSASRGDPISLPRAMTGVQAIRPGLWRWTAPHAAWRPGAAKDSPADWPREVGCALYDASDATVLIDPLLPPDHEGCLSRLDEHVGRRDRRVAILTTIGFHRRSRDQLARRYGATTSRAKRELPEGVESFPLRGAGETI